MASATSGRARPPRRDPRSARSPSAPASWPRPTAKLELASLTDPLTGLSNRRFLTLNIEPDLRHAERNHQDARRTERNLDLLSTCWTSTVSRASTTAPAIRRATRCWWSSPNACARWRAPRTRWCAGAVRSSCCQPLDGPRLGRRPGGTDPGGGGRHPLHVRSGTDRDRHLLGRLGPLSLAPRRSRGGLFRAGGEPGRPRPLSGQARGAQPRRGSLPGPTAPASRKGPLEEHGAGARRAGALRWARPRPAVPARGGQRRPGARPASGTGPTGCAGWCGSAG